MKFTPARIFTALLLGGFVAWLAAYRPFSSDRPNDPCFLEFLAGAPGDGTLVLRIDEGHGYPDDRPSDLAVKIHRTKEPLPIRLPIPPGRIRALKLRVFGTPTLELSAAQLRRASGHPLVAFSHTEVHATDETSLNTSGAKLVLAGRDLGQTSFDFELKPAEPIVVASGHEPAWWEFAGLWLGSSLALTLLGALVAPSWPRARFAQLWRAVTDAAKRQPLMTLSVVALAATIASSYPVVFSGKSFVAPNTGAHLLYYGFPTLPGAPTERPEEVKGADIVRVQTCQIPFTSLVGRAVLDDHELPLWNRYNACGVPLLGQAQTMAGDPLGLIPLLARSAWWAWDVKFLLAKALFALGLGLCVREATRRLGISALMTASAAWIGFFAYRYNHPAFFSLAYAPWILLPWLALRGEHTRRQAFWAAAGLILANWAELNSGTAKESATLIFCLNATGLLVLATTPGSWRERFRRIAPLAWACVLFVLLSAPLWLTFLDTLDRSITIFDIPRAMQLPPTLALGFFDELFTQDATRLEYHVHPSANFLFLAGVAWLFASGVCWRNRLAWALVLAALVPAGMVFSLVPGRWIVATPFLGNILYIQNAFGCVLIVVLAPLAGLGLQDAWERALRPHWLLKWGHLLTGFVLLLGAYIWFRHELVADPEALFTRTLPGGFFVVCAWALFLSAAALPIAFRGMRAGRGWGWALAGVALVAIHFRHGMYEETKFDSYVMNPRSAYDLEAKSIAIDRVHRRLTEPYRVSGISGTLSPGYQGLLELESPSGADALENRYYHELCRAAKLARVDWRLIIPENSITKLKPIYDFLNLRFYLRDPSQRPAPKGYEVIGRTDLDVIESREAWPRAFFTDRVRNYAGPEELIDLVAKGDGQPFAAFEGAAPTLTPGEHVEAARDYRFTTNSTSFTVKASGPGVAVLSETFEADNFHVTVNGAPAPYLRVNHAFKGVLLPAAGEYRIIFSYWPQVLTPALWLCACGWLLSAGSAALLWRRSTPAPATAAWHPLPTT